MKRLLSLALLACAAALAHAADDTYPSKVVRMIVPYSAGGTGDLIGRLVAQPMATLLGQQIIVDNKPGAGGNIGADATAHAAPDGYTLVMASTSLASNPALAKKMSYDPLKDLVAVSQCCGVPMVVMVNPALPIHSIKELIAYAKANPNKLTFSSSGIGTSSHLAAELFKVSTGVEMTHVPYKADGQALPDLLAGNINLMFMFQTSALPQIRSGKLRALAVSTARRSPMLPELPTIAESGVEGYDFNGWFGLFAPAGTPRPIVDKLAAAAAKVVQSPELKAELMKQGFVPVGDTPAEFTRFFGGEVAKWQRVARQGGIPKID
jgi:tripartite-type tricarboxylate transporter receptor subunit TctC